MRELISAIRNLPKHIGSAFYSLFRNGAMTIYSIIAVTVTLFMMGVIGVVAINVNKMTMNIESSLSIYVKLERDITQEQINDVGIAIDEIDGVANKTFTSKDDELEKMIDYYGDDGESYFEDYRGDNNPLASSYTVEVENADDLAEITAEINEIPNVNKANYGGASTSTLVKLLEKVRNYGMIGVGGLLIVVVLLISSTINMTIENRKTEIEIMRMVGASNWYIRIPLMIEGALIGLIGSLIPMVSIYMGYEKLFNNLNGKLMADMLMLEGPTAIAGYAWFLALIGAVVGIIGSAFAVSRNLKK